MALILMSKHATHDVVCAMQTKVHLSKSPAPVFLPRERQSNGERDG